jgi:23S rRNA (uracil1939-C5)-methyltransferase
MNTAPDMPRLSVRIEALAYGGACIGTVTSPGPQHGKKVLVPGAIPGEEVEVAVIKEQKSLIDARLTKTLRVSEQRITPPCPYFGRCGGCALQYIDLPHQRQLKLRMVESMLKHQAGLAPRAGVTLLGQELPGYHYRRRIGLHIDRSGAVGFFKLRTSEVVDIEQCRLAEPLLNQALLKLRSVASALAPFFGRAAVESHEGEVFVVLEARDEAMPAEPKDADWGQAREAFPNLKIVRGGKLAYCQIASLAAAADSASAPFGHFSQVNRAGNQVLIDTVIAEAEGGEVTDLYAGSGNISLPVAELGKTVSAVEVDPALVALGRQLAETKRLGNIQFHISSCEKFVKKHRLAPTLILDPPRSGAKLVVPQLRPTEVRKIVYVSCHLPTLGRDLKTLTGNGYLFEHLYLIDMFPQTHHVELIAVLKGRGGRS